MTGHPVLTFALLICGSVLLMLAFIAAVWALGVLWDALRGLNLRTLVWRWRRDRTWRAAEREQARADAAETCERIILLAAACAPPAAYGGDSRGAALAAQWAIADAARKGEEAQP